MIIFIPIKEHSERVPNKNFRYLDGERLYLRQINKFRKYFHVYVDTDSNEIYNKINKLNNVTVYYRKKELIGDDVSVNSLISNFINKFNIKEYICQIHVTSPFLNVETIKNIKLEKIDSIFSCDMIQSRVWKEEKGGIVPINHNPMFLEKTQDLSKLYVENSAFYIFSVKSFIRYNNRLGEKCNFIELKFPENVDIDTEDDWRLVEKIVKL